MSKDDQENLRTEYSAISQYHNSLVTFRLTLLGLFLAALGFIIGKAWPMPWPICLLGLFLTICMFIFELRTQVVFQAIARRGKEIEQKHWKSKTSTEQQFFSLQYPEMRTKNYGVPLKIFKISIDEIPLLNVDGIISHSFALDFLYTGLIIFFVVALFCSFTHP